MTEPNRYAVPLETLDEARVGQAEQVQEQSTGVRDPGSGPGTHPFGDGATGPDGDGE